MTCWQLLLTTKLFSRAVEAAMFFLKAAGFLKKSSYSRAVSAVQQVTFPWTKAYK
jgi:hypothetical protein